MDEGGTSTSGPEKKEKENSSCCIRFYIPEMTKADYMFQEKGEEELPPLKIDLIH